MRSPGAFGTRGLPFFRRPARGAGEDEETTVIRHAEPGDVPAVLTLVRALAAYEKEPDAVRMTEADLDAALFGPTPGAGAFVAVADAGTPVVGFAIWHETFSTWTGRTGAFLVDLFVDPAHRRAGHGRALLARLAAVAHERGHRRLEWDVLDWNTPAQTFYRTLGAAPMEGWTKWRLDADGIAALGATDGAPADADAHPGGRAAGGSR
jgi:GNAT superfamily N-acetyltransferase